MEGWKRGQGTSEYLVILATILVIALGAVVLIMALMPSITSTHDQQIKEYWNNVAKPFSIIEWSEDEPYAAAITYNLSVIIENMEDNQKNLTMLKIDGNDTAIIAVDGAAWADWPVPFDRGQQRTVMVELPGCMRHQSKGHEHTVTLDYDRIRGIAGQAQVGREPINFYFEGTSICGD
jgi:hypothetical protein